MLTHAYMLACMHAYTYVHVFYSYIHTYMHLHINTTQHLFEAQHLLAQKITKPRPLFETGAYLRPG